MNDREIRGLAGANRLYSDRTLRIRELKRSGRRVMGYLCIYPVVEMMTAVDLVPFRLFGNMREPVTQADTYLPTVVCPFLRSLLDIGLKGKYDFLDGVTFVHTCDVGAQFANNWKINVKTPFSFFIDMPHTTHAGALDYFKGLLQDYKKALEAYTGEPISDEKLRKAVVLQNEQRALVRSLYDCKKVDPPLISGVETLEVLIGIMSLPTDEGNVLLREVINDLHSRKPLASENRTRLMLWGGVIDDTALLKMIENLDADIVMDDTCVGSRAYFTDVEITDDPLDGLAKHYLTGIQCPRTFKEKREGATIRKYSEDLEHRFGYIGEFVGQFNVEGVILQALRYCDAHGYEIPAMTDYLKGIGIPSIYIEHNYSEAAFAPMQTRIQSFLEMIEDI
ncbi:MAG: 2-hydroxyacyl-CoA dehydratase family protein [Desulfobacterales bacterium]